MYELASALIPESRSTLCTISQLPLDPADPLLTRYPTMKLGVRDSVAYYADALMPVARRVLENEPSTRRWVLTAPPYFASPAAANLLAWAIFRGLAATSSCTKSGQVADIRLGAAERACIREARPYAYAGVAERVLNRQACYEGEGRPQVDRDDFNGRAVVMVNDINVTGTQEAFMRRMLSELGVAAIHWLYIVEVEPDLGRRSPELEGELNHLGIESFGPFAQVVIENEIDFTGRCLERIFLGPGDKLNEFFSRLPPERGRDLYARASVQAPWNEPEHRGTLDMLRSSLTVAH